jgi:transcriptional regulator with XRE-family HTH domain
VRRRRVDVGAARGRELVAATGREFLATRTNAGLSQDDVSAAAGMSRPQYGRIERGVAPEVALASVARIASALGLETSLRFFPVGDPVRDAAQNGLLERLHTHCHASLEWGTEVPFPRFGDLRAWDAIIGGLRDPGTRRPVRCGVEAETRPTDVQALDRKLALKERDGGVDRLIRLLADTRNNRAFLHGPGEALKARFPGDGRRALERLAWAMAPDSNSIILL